MCRVGFYCHVNEVKHAQVFQRNLCKEIMSKRMIHIGNSVLVKGRLYHSCYEIHQILFIPFTQVTQAKAWAKCHRLKRTQKGLSFCLHYVALIKGAANEARE